MATDPVCGMTVEPATAAARAEQSGTTYYFCSARCHDQFTAEPGKYVGGNKPMSADCGGGA